MSELRADVALFPAETDASEPHTVRVVLSVDGAPCHLVERACPDLHAALAYGDQVTAALDCLGVPWGPR